MIIECAYYTVLMELKNNIVKTIECDNLAKAREKMNEWIQEYINELDDIAILDEDGYRVYV